MILVVFLFLFFFLLIFNFKLALSLSSFILIKRLFNYSLLSAIRKVPLGVICISEVVDVFPTYLDFSM